MQAQEKTSNAVSWCNGESWQEHVWVLLRAKLRCLAQSAAQTSPAVEMLSLLSQHVLRARFQHCLKECEHFSPAVV